MKILVSGGTGLVGRYVVEGLAGAGHRVTVGRRAAAADGPSTQAATPLILDPARDQRETLAGFDAFVHLAFDHLPGRYRGGEGDNPDRFRRLNLDGSTKLFEEAKSAGVGRCIFLSSRAVYDGVAAGSRLTESMDLSPDSLYGQVKLAAEQSLAALAGPHFITTSLRATGVYGAHRPNKWDAMFADYAAEREILPRAGSEVHGDDLTAAIRCILEGDAGLVNGKAFNVSDIVTDTHEILSLYAAATGLPYPAPPPADRASVSVMETTRLQDLGWKPGGRPRLEATIRALAKHALI